MSAMVVKILEISVPEYVIKTKPNYLKIGGKVDSKIETELPDGDYEQVKLVFGSFEDNPLTVNIAPYYKSTAKGEKGVVGSPGYIEERAGLSGRIEVSGQKQAQICKVAKSVYSALEDWALQK